VLTKARVPLKFDRSQFSVNVPCYKAAQDFW